MRNTFRIHPKIKVKEIKHRSVFLNLGAGEGPGYTVVPDNVIYLNGLNENATVKTLVHEITHWAMCGYLTQDEVLKSMLDTINWMLIMAPQSLVEKTANFVAGT